MPAIRRVTTRRFRGFREFELILKPHAVIVGEPGAGKSDLLEAIVRVLDSDYLRLRRGEEMDFTDGDLSAPAEVELVVGGLSTMQARALSQLWEWWDPDAGRLISQATAADPVGVGNQERVVRLTYRLTAGVDGQFEERVYWPKVSVPNFDQFEPVRRAQRSLLPFYWQRGTAAKPLDLSGRGELRSLIEDQPGEEFSMAVSRFMDEVTSASARFSEQDRVKAALEEVLEPLRSVRRFRAESASDLIRFLPDGGAPSGLLRTLAAAITLTEGPPFLPGARHGSTLLGALRSGALLAAARSHAHAIVVVDDFGGEFDSLLALHVARKLRSAAGQLLMVTRSPAVIDGFGLSEITRMTRQGTGIRAWMGPSTTSRAERVGAYYYAGRLTRALSASAVVLVDGVHDRLALEAVERRGTEMARLESLASTGIAVIDVGGTGEIPRVAQAAKNLGLYVIALLDNDQPVGATPSREVRAAAAAADVALWLPADSQLEWLLTDGVPDTELRRALATLGQAIPDVRLPANWETDRTTDVPQLVRDTLHGVSGSLHATFVEALDATNVSPTAITALTRIREMAIRRDQSGLVNW